MHARSRSAQEALHGFHYTSPPQQTQMTNTMMLLATLALGAMAADASRVETTPMARVVGPRERTENKVAAKGEGARSPREKDTRTVLR